MWAITNKDQTLFLSISWGRFYWSTEKAIAIVFKSETEANESEEGPAREFLQFETEIFPYLNAICN